MLVRKKPVEVEAFQLTAESRASNFNWPLWMHTAWNQPGEVGSLGPVEEEDALQIVTLEGVMRVDIGDWIIKGVEGELYPCKPSIFAKTYEPVEVT